MGRTSSSCTLSRLTNRVRGVTLTITTHTIIATFCIIYLICAISNLFLGFGSSCRGGHCLDSISWEFPGEYDLDVLYGPLLCLFKPIIHFGDRVWAAGHFGLRYVSKALARRKSIEDIPTRKPNRARWKPFGKTKAALGKDQPRLPFELVIMISRQLHYADLVNVSRSSKRLRTTFFGDEDPAAVVEDLCRYACAGTLARTRCGICGIQMCTACRVEGIEKPQSNAFRHLTRCRPSCSKCFYKNHCRMKPRPGQRRQYTSYDTSSYTDYEYARRRQQADVEMSAGSSPLPRTDVCRICSRKLPAERKAVTEARDRLEVQRLARHPLACWECKEPLPAKGPRWWIDLDSERECRWFVHLPWAADA